MSKENQNNKKEVRQAWKPHWTSGAARKLFAGLFSVIKIAAGALATVLLICVVCGFVFLGVLGVYLQDDIIPNSELGFVSGGNEEYSAAGRKIFDAVCAMNKQNCTEGEAN